jgi:DNA-binding IclR family transcriptional regulator
MTDPADSHGRQSKGHSVHHHYFAALPLNSQSSHALQHEASNTRAQGPTLTDPADGHGLKSKSHPVHHHQWPCACPGVQVPAKRARPRGHHRSAAGQAVQVCLFTVWMCVWFHARV